MLSLKVKIILQKSIALILAISLFMSYCTNLYALAPWSAFQNPIIAREISAVLETPNGNKITVSDDTGSIELEDENGNKATLNSDGITLESASDISITATGDVKIEGTNVEIAANANFKAEGSGGAEVSTSAIAVLKGSLVQIN